MAVKVKTGSTPANERGQLNWGARTTAGNDERLRSTAILRARSRGAKRPSARRLGQTGIGTLAGIGFVLVVAAGFVMGSVLGGSDARDRSSSIAIGDSAARFPHKTLSDVVSYADQLSVVTVTNEVALPPPPDNTGGYIARQVTLSIDRTLWNRPEAPAAVGSIPVITWGWLLEDDTNPDSQRIPFGARHAPRLGVGGRYLTPLAQVDGEWTPLGGEAILTLDGDVVTSDVVAGSPSGLAGSLKGRRVDEVGELVGRTSPHPLAVKYKYLEPDARSEAVAREGGE